MFRWKPSAAATAGVLAAALLVQACGDDDNGPSGPPATYTLAVTLLGIGSGTVTSSPAGIDCSAAGGAGCSASFDEGTQVTLTATPSQGMQFTGWSGDGSGTTTRTVTMDRNRAVSASFDDPDKAVQQVGAQGGTVASRDGDVTLSVPAGALSSTTEITIETIDPDDLGAEWEELRAAGQIGAAYEFGPDGLTFDTPATITLEAQQVGTDGDTIRVSLAPIFTSEDGAVVPLDDLAVEVDLAAGTAVTSGKISHFSPVVITKYDQGRRIKVIAWEEAEVGETFYFTLQTDGQGTQLELSLATTGAVEQFGNPVYYGTDPVFAQLQLRCKEAGQHTYDVRFRVIPPEGSASGPFDGMFENVAVSCVPAPPVAERYHQFELETVFYLEAMFIPAAYTHAFISPEKGQSSRDLGGSWTRVGRVASAADDEAECPLVLMAGTGGAVAVDPCDGTVLREFPVVGSQNFDVLVLPAPMEDRHVMLMSGVGAYSCSLFDSGELGMCVLDSGTYPDALLIAADEPGAGAIVVRYPGTGSQIEFLRFRPDWESFQWVPISVTIPALEGAGMLKSAVAGGVPAEEFAPPEQVLAVAAMNEGAGKAFHIDLSGEEPQITEVGELAGSDPRRLRCDLESGVCAVSDYSGSRITILSWDGTGAPTITDATAEGAIAKGPVGLDVFGRRIVSAGFEDNRYSIIEVDEAGKVVSVKTEDLPEGCKKPGHATFLRDAKNTIVVSCWESNGIAVVPEAF